MLSSGSCALLVWWVVASKFLFSYSDHHRSYMGLVFPLERSEYISREQFLGHCHLGMNQSQLKFCSQQQLLGTKLIKPFVRDRESQHPVNLISWDGRSPMQTIRVDRRIGRSLESTNVNFSLSTRLIQYDYENYGKVCMAFCWWRSSTDQPGPWFALRLLSISIMERFICSRYAYVWKKIKQICILGFHCSQ